jgi:hypothetical protein
MGNTGAEGQPGGQPQPAKPGETDSRRGVEHMHTLYTVAIGLALAQAIKDVIDPARTIPFSIPVLPYFFAYLVTLLPISQGG